MSTGLTVALVTGVPLGIFIGQHFGWRETFLALSALSAVAFVVSLLFVPRSIKHTPPASLRQQLQVLTQPRLLLVYAKTAIGYHLPIILLCKPGGLAYVVRTFGERAEALHTCSHPDSSRRGSYCVGPFSTPLAGKKCTCLREHSLLE